MRGWRHPAYRVPGVPVPRRITGRALLCPFDPLIWERDRTERIFGFRYRIEIYVPEPKRQYGYYVFPFLLDGELVARVDLKADRKAGVLRVPGAFAEPGAGTRPGGRRAGRRAAGDGRLAGARRGGGRRARATSPPRWPRPGDRPGLTGAPGASTGQPVRDRLPVRLARSRGA